MFLQKNIFYAIIISLVSCFNYSKPTTVIQIETRLGIIKLKLYDDTPIHRDNFIKLIKSGFYDSLLFHRVIKEFMIQGGDPSSKRAKPGIILGNGDVDYTLPAEIKQNHFHYRGVIAAARESDDVNPTRRSSGAQFYIVQGKKFSEEELLNLQSKLNQGNYQIFFNNTLKQLVDSLSSRNSTLSSDSIKLIAIQKVNKDFKPKYYTLREKKTYEEIGGVPHLDGAYTIFGEVIEGFDVVEKISLLPTDINNRPLADLGMKIKIIQ